MKLKNQNFGNTIIILIMIILNSTCIFAQQLNVKASFNGVPASGFFAFYSSFQLERSLDFNRDGIDDLSFIDSKNNFIVIINGADHQQKWIIPLSNYFDGKFLRASDMLFYEMDGDPSTTEIVIAKHEGNHFWSPVILSVNRASSELQKDDLLAQPNYFLLGIKDIDNDGKDDIIIADTTAKTIEVLSY